MRFPATRLVSLSALTGIFSLMGGCGTLTTVNYYEVRVATGEFVYRPPGACGEPSTSVKIAIDEHAYVRIIADHSSNSIEMYIPQGNTFDFVRKGIVPVSGWPASLPAPTIGTIQRTEKSKSDPFAQEYFYAKIESGASGGERWKLSDSEAFELRLPDAHFNGSLVQIPPIAFKLKKLTFLKGMCLK